MNFTEIANTRQSCRAYDAKKDVEEKKLTAILESARLSPSACNGQPYHITVCRGDSAKAVAECVTGLGMNKFAKDAPILLVISEDINTNGKIPMLDLFFEVVAWRNGCNIWRLDSVPENKVRPFKSTKLLCNRFSVAEDTEHEMTVKISGKTIEVWYAGQNFVLYNPDLPESFHVGFTACEGECRFTEFAIKKDEQ